MSHKPAHLLLVDDDPGLLKLLGLRLTSEGYSVVTAESGAEGLRVLNREKVDLVISDLRMDEMDGMQLFAEIQKVQPGMPVIILTAHGSIPDAVAATQQGVFSFLTKPVDKDALYHAIDGALEQSAPATDDSWRESIVTRSPLMLRLLEQARMVAQSDVSVLINGQSGTGKEVFAQAIHNASPRSHKPFIAINCAAIPENMLEATLFGYEKGAFTGAVQGCPGKFEQAQGGTLLLDEITEMDPGLQAKLLRVLQDGRFHRVGQESEVAVDVRLYCTTRKSLAEQVRKGLFREDLFFRLNVLTLEMPTLRQRLADIMPLAQQFCSRISDELQRRRPRFSRSMTEFLNSYPWPGNVRQLKNALYQALTLLEGEELTPDMLRLPLMDAHESAAEQWFEGSLPEATKRFERLMLERLYPLYPSSRQLAQRLGLSHTAVANKLRDYGLNKTDAT